MKYQSFDRRPTQARNNRFSHQAVTFLIKHGVSPNTISGGSVLFSVIAGISLGMTSSDSHRLWWVSAAIFIALRLLANMLDGMVAIETGKVSPVGELFNEVPDRISDVVIFIGAGFAAGGSYHLGYVAAILALFTAYVRTLGNQLGVLHLFLGPMGKPNRMFILVGLCFYKALAPVSWELPSLMAWVLLIICLGSFMTTVARLRHIVVKVRM